MFLKTEIEDSQKYFIKVIELYDKNAAKPFGHSAIVLVYNDGNGIYYSKEECKSLKETIFEKLFRFLKALSIGVKGKIVKLDLNNEDVRSIENGDFNTRHGNELNSYKNKSSIIHDIPYKESGFRMYIEAEKIYKNTCWFHILFANCIKFAKRILAAGDIKGPKSLIPNYAQEEQVNCYKKDLQSEVLRKSVDDSLKIKSGVIPPTYVNRLPFTFEKSYTTSRRKNTPFSSVHSSIDRKEMKLNVMNEKSERGFQKIF